MSNACGARHFVNKVQADEQLRLAARQRADGVRVPDFVKKCLSHDRAFRRTARVPRQNTLMLPFARSGRAGITHRDA